GDLVIVVGGDVGDVVPPRFARVDAQLFGALPLQQIHRAFDVGGGERLPVMPFDALVQREGQLGAALAPVPAGSELGDDVVGGVLQLVLLVDDEVVEHGAHRPVHRDGRFLE